jgi:hypothetical protein
MVPEFTPNPTVTLTVGQTFDLDFFTNTNTPFHGVVRLEGAGGLQPPIYYFPSAIIPSPEPPSYPYPLPPGYMPVIYESFSPSVVSMPYLFETVQYTASAPGNAKITLDLVTDMYVETIDLGGGLIFTVVNWSFQDINSFNITVVAPEPMTAALLALGALLIKRK